MRLISFITLGFAALAALTPTSALASSTKLPLLHRSMGCYSYQLGFLYFNQAVELTGATTYALAPDAKNHHLSGKQAKGTYHRKGTVLTFLTGPWGKLHLTGDWTPQKKDAFGNVIGAGLTMYRSHNKVYTGVKCYPD